MRTFLLSPRWLALHALAILLVAAFAALGWWQLDAYRTSESRHELRAAEPVPLAEVDLSRPITDALDRPVLATGTYVAELVVPARVKGGVLGVYAAGVFETNAGVLTVLRGWSVSADEVPSAPRGQISLTGYVLPAEPDSMASGRTTEPGEISFLAPETVKAALGTENVVVDALLLVTDERPAPAVVPERIDIDAHAPIRNVGPWQNLSYWAQWWVFGGAVVVFWISFVRTAVTRSRQVPPPASDRPESLPRPFAPR